MYYDSLKARVKAANAHKQREKEARALLDSLDIKQHIAPVYFPLHDDIQAGAHTVYNLPGGRGSCKSSFVSLEIVKGVMDDTTGQSNAIVFRLVAGTMRDSVFSQIAWAIDTLGVNHLWKSRVSPMQYTYTPTGATITFRGLDDAGKLKSIKPPKGVYRFIWFEEFSELPGPNFLRSVMQSVQRGGDNFTIFHSFNPPISQNNWANQYIEQPDDRAITLLTDYTMVPQAWLGEAFLYEAERLKEINQKAYEHEYLGIPTGSGGEVFPNLEIRAITDDEISLMEYIYQGVDFGFAVDPAGFLRVSFNKKTDTIFLLDEIYERGLSNRQLAQRIKEKKYDVGRGTWFSLIDQTAYQREALIICDAAEPKSISDLRQTDLKVMACHKEPGCVEYRTKWLQHRKIVVDPARTPNAYRELVNYQYATDKDGNFLSVLPDKDNHAIDALAYALDRQIYFRQGLSA